MPEVPNDPKFGSPIRIAVIGVGGTGCALLPLLAVQQIAEVTLVDGDTVEAVNLPRQLLYAPGDLGKAKVSVAAAAMRAKGDEISWREEFRFVDARNVRDLLRDQDVVADCTDDLHVRHLIAHTCKEMDITLVTGAVHEKQVQVFTRIPKQHVAPFFPGHPAEEQEGCDMRAVPAGITTMTAALMSLRIADLLQGGDGLAGIMDLLDVDHGRWMRIMGPTAGELMDTPITPSRHV